MIKKYRKKPVVIEAVQLRTDTLDDVCKFVDNGSPGSRVFVSNISNTEFIYNYFPNFTRLGVIIHTLEGDHLALEDDYIIKGVNGEFYPCKPDIFEKTYEHFE